MFLMQNPFLHICLLGFGTEILSHHTNLIIWKNLIRLIKKKTGVSKEAVNLSYWRKQICILKYSGLRWLNSLRNLCVFVIVLQRQITSSSSSFITAHKNATIAHTKVVKHYQYVLKKKKKRYQQWVGTHADRHFQTLSFVCVWALSERQRYLFTVCFYKRWEL